MPQLMELKRNKILNSKLKTNNSNWLQRNGTNYNFKRKIISIQRNNSGFKLYECKSGGIKLRGPD
jgi:hypothetical protein